MSLRATRWAWTVRDISPTQRLVLLRLSDRANDQDNAWPSITSLANDTSLGRRSVIRALELLRDRELIVQIGSDGGQSGQNTVYRVMCGPRSKRPRGGATVAPLDADPRGPGGATVAPPEKGPSGHSGTSGGATVARPSGATVAHRIYQPTNQLTDQGASASALAGAEADAPLTENENLPGDMLRICRQILGEEG